MYRACLYLILAVLILCCAGCASQSSEQTGAVKVHAYNDHLYCITHDDPFSANLYASIGEDGILLVDTGLPLQTEDLRKTLRSISDKSIRYVVLTHSHPDHTGGLDTFGEGATLIAHTKAQEQEFYHLPPRVLFEGETILIDEERSIRFNGEEIRFIPLAPAHSNDEILVHFTGSNLLCTGSSILPDGFIFVDWDREGDLDASFDRVRMLAETWPDVPYAPAHGPDLDRRDALAWLNEMQKSRDVITEKVKEGMNVEAILASNALNPWANYTNFPNADRYWVTTVARHNGVYKEPLPPVVEPMTAVIEEDGVDAALALYHELQSKQPDAYQYGEAQLNLLGYQLLYRDRYDEALKVLKENMELFPESPNVYDSYGEAMLAKGDTTQAIRYYEQALEVDSTYQFSRDALRTLK